MKLALNSNFWTKYKNRWYIDDEWCLKRHNGILYIFPFCEVCGIGQYEKKRIDNTHICNIIPTKISSQMDLDLFLQNKVKNYFKSFLSITVEI